jgi:hypothetical protein
MLMGKPAIGTNYSGNLAFMHPRNSLLVDYELTEIASDNPTYKAGNHWAEPSIEHAASQMRYCFEHRAAAAELGAKGRDEVQPKLSLKAAGPAHGGAVGECERIRCRGNSTRQIASRDCPSAAPSFGAAARHRTSIGRRTVVEPTRPNHETPSCSMSISRM